MATMIENKQMEEISFAYLQAVCAKVGIAVTRHTHDGDGIDGDLNKVVYLLDGRRFDVTIGFQLKSTCRNVKEEEEEISYDLKIKNYNDLRAESTSKKFLFVHFFPESFDDSLVHSPTCLQIRRCMYWAKGSDFEEKDAKSTVRIKLSKNNATSPERLASLFQELAEEEVL